MYTAHLLLDGGGLLVLLGRRLVLGRSLLVLLVLRLLLLLLLLDLDRGRCLLQEE